MASDSVNASFSFDLEISGVLMKRSGLKVKADDERTFLELDVFASGLGSLVGGEAAETSDDEDVKAGMEITLFGNSLRPFIFFESTSDLLNIYWSGKAEEKNTAIQVKAKDLLLFPEFWRSSFYIFCLSFCEYVFQ